jgi:hypothetical protein
MSGAVFAGMAYLLFIGGFLRGSLFPEIPKTSSVAVPIASKGETASTKAAGAATKEQASGPSKTVVSDLSKATGVEIVKSNDDVSAAQKKLRVEDLLQYSQPESGTELAKLFVWCFIAGFAERLVPDTLNRLISRKIAVLTDTPPDTFMPVPTPLLNPLASNTPGSHDKPKT